MAKKYYAVKVGREPGIYETWKECQKNTSGFKGALFKSFLNFDDAKDYLNNAATETIEDPTNMQFDTEAVAYVDGSCKDFENKMQITKDGKHPANYSYAVVILHNGQETHFSGVGQSKDMMKIRNVAGEIMASMVAMKYAYDHNIKSITIIHDYQGVASWCVDGWNMNCDSAKQYKAFYDKISKKVLVKFKKVKSHTGIFYNDVVDALAKQALGLEIKKKMQDHIDEIAKK